MRFGISTILIVTVCIAILCGIIFTLPLAVGGLILAFLLIISPAVWVTGAVYTKRATQAFFISGIVVGFTPHVCIIYYIIMIVLSSIDEIFKSGLSLGLDAEPAELLQYRITLAVYWLVPGIFSICGGGLGALTHRLLIGKAPAASE